MLSREDRLRLLNFPKDMHEVVHKTIVDFGWEIQSVSPGKYDIQQCYEFKLKGWPWWTSGKKGVKSRVLIMKVILALLENGYRKVDHF